VDSSWIRRYVNEATWHTGVMTTGLELTFDADTAAPFACPRCATTVSQRFYGPCESCCIALRAKFLTVGRNVEVAEYVPKMNVTPNAVALKDD